MSQKRSEQELDSSSVQSQASIGVMAEAVRSAADSSGRKASPKNDDEHISVFWRVFGGTLLSMVALGAVTLYNSISSSVAELRADMNHERDARVELVKKDEFNARSTAMYERMRTFEGLKAEFEGYKERVNANVAAFDGLKKDTAASVAALQKDTVTVSDAEKKDCAALDVLKERVIALEAVKKDVVGVEVLKEKLTTVAAELKLVHDDVVKVQQEVERNKLGDAERKASRDAQSKQVEESLKELQKALQDCREKLARLEGARSTQTTDPMLIPARHSSSVETKGSGDNSPATSKTGSGENAGSSKPSPTAIPDGM